MRRSTN
nr:unnamed protein product [Timema californicum]